MMRTLCPIQQLFLCFVSNAQLCVLSQEMCVTLKQNYSSAILNQNEVGHFEVSFDGQFCCRFFYFSFLNESMSLFPQRHLITGNFHEEQTKGFFYLSIMLLRGENSLMQMKIIKAFCATINCLRICPCKHSAQPSRTAASCPPALKSCALGLFTPQLKRSV